MTENTDIFKNADAFQAELAKIESGDIESVDNTENIDAQESPEAQRNDDVSESQEDYQEALAPEKEQAEEVEEGEEEESVKSMIPRSRLNKESKRRKELEQKYQEERDGRVRMQHELEMLKQTIHEMANPQAQQESAEFDPLDPEAKEYVDKKLQKVEEKQQEISSRQAQIEYANHIESQRIEFTKKHPDVVEAYHYVGDLKYKENIALGMQPEDAMQQVDRTMGFIAASAYHQSKNIPQTFYELAKTYGYKTKTSAARTGPNLEAIERNILRSKSVLSIPAAPSGGPNTSSYMTEAGMKSLQKSTGAIDANKFNEALKKIQANHQYN